MAIGDLGAGERRRVEAMVQTLAATSCRGESLAEVAHDARNMVTALSLYCDLLEEPGVLAVPFAHYGRELRLVAAASRRLVEKLAALDVQVSGGLQSGLDTGLLETGASAAGSLDGPKFDVSGLAVPGTGDLRPAAWNGAGRDRLRDGRPRGNPPTQDLTDDSTADSSGSSAARSPVSVAATASGPEPPSEPSPGPASGQGRERTTDRGRQWDSMFSAPVNNLAAELMANRNLLSALAGPGIVVTVDALGGARPVRLSAEDLTRLLVNLIKNAAEAIPASPARGHIQIDLRERSGRAGAAESLLLAVEDNGPGIAPEALDRIFDSGFTTRLRNAPQNGWPVVHRGLGLAITRSIVEAAGGRIEAANRSQGGARFEIELPVRVT
jgi:hypothetical protein